MSEKNIKGRLIQKHDTAENWAKATTFIPKQGEIIIYDIDSEYNYERMKIGDGKTVVDSLPFLSSGNGGGATSWNDLTDRPFYDIEKEVDGGSITWDGNPDGLTRIPFSDDVYAYRISEATPTMSDLSNGYTFTMTTPEGNMTGDHNILPFVDGDGFLSNDLCLILSTDMEMDGVVYPKGTYVIGELADGIVLVYISEFTINGYNGFRSVQKIAKTIDKKYLPKALQFGEEIGVDTLAWDGNTNGLTTWDMDGSMYYKVSDVTPAFKDLLSYSCTFPMDGENFTVTNVDFPTVAVIDGIIVIALGMIWIVDEKLAGTEKEIDGEMFAFPSEPGIYAAEQFSLTINGYTGFKPSGSMLKWDGNTEGLDATDLYFANLQNGFMYYRVSHASPSLLDLENGYSVTLDTSVGIVTFTSDDYPVAESNDIYLILANGIIVVQTTDILIGNMIYLEKGVYITNFAGADIYSCSFSIPGYTGFGSDFKIETIDTKYLPSKYLQQDWNESNSDSAQYIKNRTHFKVIMHKPYNTAHSIEHYDSMSCGGLYGYYNNWEVTSWYIDGRYPNSVVIDDADRYESCHTFYYYPDGSETVDINVIDYWGVGNERFVRPTASNNGLPFCILIPSGAEMQGMPTYFFHEVSDYHTYELSEQTTQYKTLPVDYIPSITSDKLQTIPVGKGGTGYTSMTDTVYTTARYRASSLHETEVDPSVNGYICWTYE